MVPDGFHFHIPSVVFLSLCTYKDSLITHFPEKLSDINDTVYMAKMIRFGKCEFGSVEQTESEGHSPSEPQR